MGALGQIIGEIMAAAAAARAAGLLAAAEASSASTLSNSEVLGNTGVEVYPGTAGGLSFIESGIEVYPGTGRNLVESEGVRRPHPLSLLAKMQLAKLFREYEDRLGEGIGLVRARELVKDALLAKRQTFSQDLVEQYASEMLTEARHDARVAGHVSLQGFLRYVEQQRELFDALLLQQPSLAPGKADNDGVTYRNESWHAACAHIIHAHTSFMRSHHPCAHIIHAHTSSMHTHHP